MDQFIFGQGDDSLHHYLYVATPGVRNYLEYGGHGLIVLDMDHSFAFVKRIPTGGFDEKGKPSNVKGICANAATHRIYISTLSSLICIDLITEKLVWENKYQDGCDRMTISPDGKWIFLPSLEGDNWKIVDAQSGKVLYRLSPNSGSHNTIYGLDGRKVYLAGLHSTYLSVADVGLKTISRKVGPFGHFIRPFTINGKQTRCYVNTDSLLGFEVGDLESGRVIRRIHVKGFGAGPVKRHGCPSHGIALSPDEKEIWLADAFNESVHIFELSDTMINQVKTIKLSDQPGWVSFSLDGRYAFPSTGEIIEAKGKKIIARLQDEYGNFIQSEKMIEIDFKGKSPAMAGDQFGIGKVLK